MIHFFDNLDEDAIIPPSPQEREKQLTENILSIDDSLPTLCIMGQWHTQPKVVTNGETRHESALYRLRKTKPNVPFIHNVYRQGQLFNDGKIIELPKNPSIPPYYEIVQKTDIDFELHIPEATKISLCKNSERLLSKLTIVKLSVKSILLQQSFVIALLDNIPILNHQNQISVANSTQTMCNNKTSFSLHQLLHGFLDKDFGARINRACRFVQKSTSAPSLTLLWQLSAAAFLPGKY